MHFSSKISSTVVVVAAAVVVAVLPAVLLRG